MWTKLRGDFTLALVVAFGALTVLGVTPFAVYRLRHGQLLHGLLDLGLVATIGIGVAHAWRSGRTGGTALLIAVIYSAGCIIVAHLAGLSGLLWVYPVLLANFLLVGRARAAFLSAIVVASVATIDAILPGMLHKALFVVTALEVSLFSYVFAWRAEMQRTRLEAMAAHDPLTGAHNRRNMAAELKAAMAASVRDGTPLGLLIFDLDHFKAVNDTLGHEAGDRVLVQVSELVRRATRKQDGFFRLGGEEFGLLVPGADAGSLHRIAEELRATVQAKVRCGDRAVTMSVGAANYCPGESAGSWQRRADLAMYRAKRDGRNRTVLDDCCEHMAAATNARKGPE